MLDYLRFRKTTADRCSAVKMRLVFFFACGVIRVYGARETLHWTGSGRARRPCSESTEAASGRAPTGAALQCAIRLSAALCVQLLICCRFGTPRNTLLLRDRPGNVMPPSGNLMSSVAAAAAAATAVGWHWFRSRRPGGSQNYDSAKR